MVPDNLPRIAATAQSMNMLVSDPKGALCLRRPATAAPAPRADAAARRFPGAGREAAA